MLVKLERSNTVFHKLDLSSLFQKTGVPASQPSAQQLLSLCPFISQHYCTPDILSVQKQTAKAFTVTSQEEYCFDVLLKVQGTSQTNCKLNLEAEWGIGLQTATLFTPQTSPVSFLPVWNKTAQQLTHKQKLKIQF